MKSSRVNDSKACQWNGGKLIALCALAIGSSSVWGGPEPANNYGDFSVTYTFSLSFGGGSGGSRCVSLRYPERGVIEGEGSGFIDDPAPELAEVLTVLDIAHRLMRGEQVDLKTGKSYKPEASRRFAIEAFEVHQEDYPSDWYSMREHSLLLLWDGQFEFGLAKLLQSYLGDPALVRIGIDTTLFGDGSQELIKLSQRLVRYAKANESGSAWFAVAMILQSKGSYEHAKKNLDRAIEAGFDQAVCEKMGRAIDEELGVLNGPRLDR